MARQTAKIVRENSDLLKEKRLLELKMIDMGVAVVAQLSLMSPEPVEKRRFARWFKIRTGSPPPPNLFSQLRHPAIYDHVDVAENDATGRRVRRGRPVTSRRVHMMTAQAKVYLRERGMCPDLTDPGPGPPQDSHECPPDDT